MEFSFDLYRTMDRYGFKTLRAFSDFVELHETTVRKWSNHTTEPRKTTILMIKAKLRSREFKNV